MNLVKKGKKEKNAGSSRPINNPAWLKKNKNPKPMKLFYEVGVYFPYKPNLLRKITDA